MSIPLPLNLRHIWSLWQICKNPLTKLCQTPLNTIEDIFKWWARIAASVLRAGREWGLRQWRGHALRGQRVAPVPHLDLIWKSPKLWNFWNATWLFTVSSGAFFFFCSHSLILLGDTGKGVRICSKHFRISCACGDSAPSCVPFSKDSRMWNVCSHRARASCYCLSTCSSYHSPSQFPLLSPVFRRGSAWDAPAHHINKNNFCGSHLHCSCGECCQCLHKDRCVATFSIAAGRLPSAKTSAKCCKSFWVSTKTDQEFFVFPLTHPN